MTLKDLAEEGNLEVLPLYLFVSLILHFIVFFVIPNPLKIKSEKRFFVSFIPETKVSLLKKKARSREFPKGLLALEKFLERREREVLLSEKIPPPISIPKSVERNVRERIRTALGPNLNLESKFTFPVEIVPPERVEVNPERIPVVIPKGILSKTRESESEKERVLRSGPLEFKGPVVERRLIFAPPFPSVRMGMVTVVKLKFWVRPDGSVSSVRLLKLEGDPSLGPVALQYVKELRFNSVDPKSGSVWGEVKVRFVPR